MQFWGSALCFAMCLPGIFANTKQSAFLNALGDLSFPVYLLHIMVIAEAVNIKNDSYAAAISLIIVLAFLALVTAAAVASHWLLEKPVALAMHSTSDIMPSQQHYRSPGLNGKSTAPI
jgi:peptidoglycan/LPS O-acetylase OafA/YrhL